MNAITTCTDYEIASLCRAEERLERFFKRIIEKLNDLPSFKALRRLEWSGVGTTPKTNWCIYRLVRSDGLVLWDKDVHGKLFWRDEDLEKFIESGAVQEVTS